MERCPHCGNKLSSIDVLCPKCGAVVEVIQTKSNIPSPSENVTDSDAQKPEAVQKKDIPKYFNVYYEDLPDEDSVDSESEEVPDETTEEPVPPAPPVADEQSGGNRRGIIEESGYNEIDTGNGFAGTKATPKAVPEETVKSKAAGEDDNDYSSRYLENLKNLDLPEIDDISNFDPEEYMREYKYRKILHNQAASDNSSAPKKRQWLEIEETDNPVKEAYSPFKAADSPVEEADGNLASELKKVKDDVQNREAGEPVAERRYRSARSDQAEKRQSSHIVAKQEPAAEENIQIPVKSKKRKPNVLSMVLFWIVISVAIFFGCLFIDHNVKYYHGTYDSFIYSITNGQVDLDPGKP